MVVPTEPWDCDVAHRVRLRRAVGDGRFGRLLLLRLRVAVGLGTTIAGVLCVRTVAVCLVFDRANRTHTSR